MDDFSLIEDKFVIRNAGLTFSFMPILSGCILCVFLTWTHVFFLDGYVLQNDTKVVFPGFNFATIVIFILAGLVLGNLIYSLFSLFDRRPKLILTKKGLWHPKCEFIEWKNVWYLADEIQKGKYRFITIIIKLKEPEMQLKLHVLNIDCNLKLFLEKFNYYKGDNKIIEMIEE
jgi:hypothetical protein